MKHNQSSQHEKDYFRKSTGGLPLEATEHQLEKIAKKHRYQCYELHHLHNRRNEGIFIENENGFFIYFPKKEKPGQYRIAQAIEGLICKYNYHQDSHHD